MPVRVYHGTCQCFLQEIKSEGLKPQHGGGADTWAVQHGHGNIAERTARHAQSVYVTTLREFAEEFAHIVAEEHNSTPCVLELEVPSNEFKAQFIPDDASSAPDTLFLVGGPIGFRTEKPIPPSWIKKTYVSISNTYEPV